SLSRQCSAAAGLIRSRIRARSAGGQTDASLFEGNRAGSEPAGQGNNGEEELRFRENCGKATGRRDVAAGHKGGRRGQESAEELWRLQQRQPGVELASGLQPCHLVVTAAAAADVRRERLFFYQGGLAVH